VEQRKEVRKRRQMFIVFLTLGVVLAGASLLLRILTAGKYEVQTIDLIFLVIPLLLLALATNRLKSLDLFGLRVDFADLWAEVGQTDIRDQVSDSKLIDAIDAFETATKGSLQDLRSQLGRGSLIEALKFQLRLGTHTHEVIKTYFDALSDSLRIVVVNELDDKLFAIYNAPDLISSLRFTESKGYEELADMLNSGSEEARSKLSTLPGFIGGDNVVTENTSKREALAKMEELNTDILPVVNEEGRFIGTVGRSKLTAGLILAVTDKLEDR
jgi:hypothetical protein